MVEDNDDTTELSDAVLTRRLKRLRGEAAPEPPATTTVWQTATTAGPRHDYQLPDLTSLGLLATEYQVTKESLDGAWHHRLTCDVIKDEMVEEVQKSMRFDLRLHCPEMFPMVKSMDVVAERYDADTRRAIFRPIHDATAAAPAVPRPPKHPVLLIIGRRDRAEEFARVRGLSDVQWRWVRSERDMLGYSPGTKIVVLDEGHPNSPEELEKLLEIATARGYSAEMITFGRTSPSEF